jgi:heme/copper-type cytochrome/quinol oxidase subunit 2
MVTFEIGLLVCIITILVWFFISCTVVYCKYAGSPYKNPDFRKKNNQIAIVFLLWAISFIGKIIVSFFGTKIYDKEESSGDDFVESMLLIVNSLVFEVFPYVLTLDVNFIKILQLNYLSEHPYDMLVDFQA